MSVNNSGIADMAQELVITTLTGGFDVIGVLTANPVMIIFDNQGLVPVGISNNPNFVWHTFPAGEAIVLDLRDKAHLASNFTFRIGTTIYAKGAAGAALFSVSYIFADSV
jgi:hypothetical protein